MRLAWSVVLLIAGVTCSSFLVEPARAQWPQWGGPDRNFTVDTEGLADSWPEGGPKTLWKRELGDGYSSIVFDDGVLYTMYRKNPTETFEYTVAMDAGTGNTLWQHRNPSPLPRDQDHPGPHATPLIVGNRLVTIGTNAVMHCFDKMEGQLLWRHDLVREFGAPFPGFNGYASSPVAYGDMIILSVDRERGNGSADTRSRGRAGERDEETGSVGQALMAFDQESGGVVWRNHDFKIGPSSPILITFQGEEQLVLLSKEAIIGVRPGDGALLWTYPFGEEAEYLMTPVWMGDGRLFISSTPAGGKGGSRMIELTRNDNRIIPTQLWHSRRIRFIQGNPIAVGEHLYGASGHNPALIVGVDALTGKRLWGQRGFEQAVCVFGDGKLIFLDWDGKLALASVTPDGLTIHSQCQVTVRESFTAPTLVGKILYLRDRKHIMALDLG